MRYLYDFISTCTKSEIDIYNSILSLESVHPIDLLNDTSNALTEAANDAKSAISAVTEIANYITSSNEKFQTMAKTLKQSNKVWINNANRFTTSLRDLKTDNFEYEIFPYYDGYSKLMDINIPPYSPNENYDAVEVPDKNIFRGGDTKIKITSRNMTDIYSKCLRYVSKYDSLVNKIVSGNNAILKNVKSNMPNIPVTESTVLSMSMYKNEYTNILLEAFTTPSQIDKTIKTNGKENTQAKTGTVTIASLKNYAKKYYAIQSAKMDIAEEAYSECAKFLNKVLKLKKSNVSDNTETTVATSAAKTTEVNAAEVAQ